MPSIGLGTWGANDQANSEHRYKFTVTLDSGARDNNSRAAPPAFASSGTPSPSLN